MIGKILGQYVIEAPLGEGGMGVVYRARDTRLDRSVAIKVVADLPADDTTARSRLLREARAASALSHPGICTVHQVEEVEGQTFLVMELVEGHPLSGMIPPGGLPLDAVLRYGIQIADALAHAHERGVVHRDLKSLNVMVTSGDRIKILDFGLAKRSGPLATGDATRSVTAAGVGTVAGTLAYMAPEVLRGEPADAGSDIWALGIMLYEMVSGGRPFLGNTGYALTAAIMHDAPAPLPESVPDTFRAVITRCLARDRAERYQSATEIRAVLEAIAAPSALAIGTDVRRVPRRRLITAAAWAVAAAAIAMLSWFVSGPMRSGSDGIESVAVLPFANDSRDPDADYLSDGLGEHLLNSLSHVPSLKVMSRSAVLRHKNSASNPEQIGRELGVNAVVTGHLSRSGDRLVVSLELVDVRDGSRLWGDRYDRPVTDVLAIQQDITRGVAGRLRSGLTGDEHEQVVKRPTENPRAYELYLKGRYHTAKYTEEGFRTGNGFFRQAIEADPTFALAYEGLAYNYGSTGEWALAPRDAFPRARAAAERALELDATLADAHSVLGLVSHGHDWDWTGAERHFKRAIELNPGSVLAHENYGQLLASLKRATESQAEAQRAQTLDPLSMEANTYLGTVFFFARQYDAAYAQLRRTVELEDNFWFARLWLGRATERLGKPEEALREAEQANSMAGDISEALAQVGRLKAAAGDRRGATQILDELSARSRLRYVSPYFSAVIQAALGDRDAAFASLDRGFEARTFFMTWLLIDPDLDPLRDDTRFDALVRKVGLKP